MSAATLLAPAKLNLCLYLGGVRDDGLHELVSLFMPIALADELAIERAERDEVICEGVEGPDLTAAALEKLRDAGWDAPPLRITVNKRIPVAAGLGGGSADAAAVLRLAAGGGPPGLLGDGGGNGDGPAISEIERIARELGADVPSQLRPRSALVGGAGEVVEPVAQPAPHSVVLVAFDRGLSTADVYAEADRLGSHRSAAELEEARDRLTAAMAAAMPERGHDPLMQAAGSGAPDVLALGDLLVNDLQPAALSLRPEIEEALDALRAEGAAHAMLTGSGPTAFGLFAAPGAAHLAAHRLGERFPAVIVTGPMGTVAAR